MPNDETIRQFRNRVSNKPGRRRFAWRVEARNHAMSFARDVIKRNKKTPKEFAQDAGIDLSELKGIMTRDPDIFPTRDLLYSIREASAAPLPQGLIFKLSVALELIDLVARIEAIEKAKEPNLRKIFQDAFPSLCRDPKYRQQLAGI